MQLHDLTALEQAAAIRQGEFTATELARHYLARIERHGDTVGAFVTLTAELALDEAAAVDARIADDDAGDSPLLGCVAPVKDLDLLAGVRCTFGSRAFWDFVPDTDAEFVRRMRAAGLVIPGKSNTPELGVACYTENQVAPPARTPWDLRYSAGGSSGGAAAAVATGLASVAQGSDGGGSIRIPAAVTGLVGIKPARGRIGWSPGVDGVGELAVPGPIGRTVADAAALLDVMAGASAGDPVALPPPAPWAFLAAARTKPGRLRIGRYSQPVFFDEPIDPQCLGAYERVSRLMAELGHEVVDIARPFGPDVVPAFETLWASGAAAALVPPEHEELLMPLTRWLREIGRRHSGADIFVAVDELRRVSRSAIERYADYDAVLTPALATPPVRVGELRNDEDPAADFAAQEAFTPFTSPYNVSGQPAIALPAGFTDSGLPLAVQVVGRPRDEYTIISLAAQLEEALGVDLAHHGLW